MKKIKWGILGTGNIANSFCQDLLLSENSQITHVYSRDSTNAKEFAQKHDSLHHTNNLNDFLSGDFDIAYVATPNHLHVLHSRSCLNTGHAVLCEKPVSLSASECADLIALAKEKQLFFMEALWMSFIPTYQELLARIQKGQIGTPRFARADFCFRVPYSPTNRYFSLSKGGGALMDVGIYPITLSNAVFGFPESYSARAKLINKNRIDETTSIILEYDHTLSNLNCSLRTSMPVRASIYGTEGSLHLTEPFYRTNTLIHHPGNDPEISPQHIEGKFRRTLQRIKNRFLYPRGHLSPRKHTYPIMGNGYYYEIKECERCISDNQIESKLHNHNKMLTGAQLLENIRMDIGVTYDCEEYSTL